MATDSDSYTNTECIDELLKVIETKENVKAVGGEVAVFNAKNVLTTLSAIRFFYACNIERNS